MARRHPGNLERRGDSYRVRLSVGGRRHYFTVPTTDRRLAERFALERLRELEEAHEREALGLPRSTPLSALLSTFVEQELPTRARGTQRSYRDSLKAIRRYFVDHLGDPQLTSVRPKDVAAFLSWRRVNRFHREDRLRSRAAPKATTVSNRTLQKDRAVLHRIFAFAEQLELRGGNPVDLVGPPKADPRTPVILSDEQFDALLVACEPHPMLKLYVLLLAETGMRSMSEALFLRWEDVDLAAGFIWVSSGRDGHRTKSGRGRWIPMTDRLVVAMREHFAMYRLAAYEGARALWVFHHVRTGRHHKAGARIGSLRNAFYNAVRRAHLKVDVHQHDLRHRRVTTWLAGGKNPVLVKEAMGHSDLRVTMGYAHLAKEHLRALVDGRPDVGAPLQAASN